MARQHFLTQQSNVPSSTFLSITEEAIGKLNFSQNQSAKFQRRLVLSPQIVGNIFALHLAHGCDEKIPKKPLKLFQIMRLQIACKTPSFSALKIMRKSDVRYSRDNVSIILANLSTIAYLTNQSVIQESGITRRRQSKNVHRLRFLSFSPPDRARLARLADFSFRTWEPVHRLLGPKRDNKDAECSERRKCPEIQAIRMTHLTPTLLKG